MVDRVALQIRGLAAGVSDRRVVDVGRFGVGAGEHRHADQGQDEGVVNRKARGGQ